MTHAASHCRITLQSTATEHAAPKHWGQQQDLKLKAERLHFRCLHTRKVGIIDASLAGNVQVRLKLMQEVCTSNGAGRKLRQRMYSSLYLIG